jgi:hypothetical protein
VSRQRQRRVIASGRRAHTRRYPQQWPPREPQIAEPDDASPMVASRWHSGFASARPAGCSSWRAALAAPARLVEMVRSLQDDGADGARIVLLLGGPDAAVSSAQRLAGALPPMRS